MASHGLRDGGRGDGSEHLVNAVRRIRRAPPAPRSEWPIGLGSGRERTGRRRLAVDDRVRNADTSEWETAHTIFHDVVAFGRLAERTFGTLHVGDAVIAHGEFRFRSYEDAAGSNRTGASFVASRIGPDMLLAGVTVARARERHSVPSGPNAERAADVPASPGPRGRPVMM